MGAGQFVTLEQTTSIDPLFYTVLNQTISTQVRVTNPGTYEIVFTAKGFISPTVSPGNQWGLAIGLNSAPIAQFLGGGATGIDEPDLIVGQTILTLAANDTISLIVGTNEPTDTALVSLASPILNFTDGGGSSAFTDSATLSIKLLDQ